MVCVSFTDGHTNRFTTVLAVGLCSNMITALNYDEVERTMKGSDWIIETVYQLGDYTPGSIHDLL
jgi:hypothetical protein